MPGLITVILPNSPLERNLMVLIGGSLLLIMTEVMLGNGELKDFSRKRKTAGFWIK
jgi:hypothetical protein